VAAIERAGRRALVTYALIPGGGGDPWEWRRLVPEPFTFAFHDSHITFVLFRDAPKIDAAWWFTAAVMWCAT
jgi:hypothetical protein